MQDVSGLVTTTVSNIKISEVKNKIPLVSNLVKKTEFHAKILEIEGSTLLILITINLRVTYLI